MQVLDDEDSGICARLGITTNQNNPILRPREVVLVLREFDTGPCSFLEVIDGASAFPD
jgi:hypothetical protein